MLLSSAPVSPSAPPPDPSPTPRRRLAHASLRLAGVAFALLALGGPARAAELDAEALISQGIALREQGKDDQALELFRQAEAKGKTPRATAQVALAEQALGMWVLAEAHLGAALAAKGDPWIEKNRAALEGALAVVQKHVGALEVRANVPAAEVYIDGALAGSLPREAALRVEVGPRRVEVRAAGYHRVARSVVIATETLARETFTLAPLPPTPPPGAGAGGRGGPREAPPLVLTTPTNVPRTVGWALVGVAGGAAVFGGVSFLIREVQTGRYNDRTDCPGVDKPSQPAACQSILDAEATWRTVGVASFVGAGVLGAAGLGLVVFAPTPKAPAAPKVACGPAALGLQCAGTF